MAKRWRPREDLSVDDIAARYAKGQPIAEIAGELGAAPWTIHKRLRDAGVDTSLNRRVNAMDWNAIAKRYRAGASARQLGAELGVSGDVVARRIRDLGVRVDGRYERSRRAVLCGAAWMKRCLGCREALPPESFHKSPPGISGLKSRCIRCERSRVMKHRYGISLDDAERMLADQKGGCAICGFSITIDGAVRGRRSSARVDHCHSTGRVRGLLCKECNLALGLMEDRPERFRSAADYLDRTSLDPLRDQDPRSDEPG
jgi:hypothetical protein